MPAPNKPTPNARPCHAASRARGARNHNMNRIDRVASVTSGTANGAKPNTDAAPAASASRRVSIEPSQRLDLDLAELDRPAGPLQRERAACELGVLDVDGLRPVQHEDDARPARRDLVQVPLAAGLWHRLRDRREFGERA